MKPVVLFFLLICWGLCAQNSVVFLKPSDINRAGSNNNVLVIKQPGTYIFTDDVFFTKVNAVAITIDSDDVILDLDGRTLRAANPGGENVGIHIVNTNAFRSNITIRNGSIAGFNVFNIEVDEGLNKITLENISIVSSNIRGRTELTPTGILFHGISLSDIRTTNVVINNCYVNNARFGLRAVATDNVKIINSVFNSNGSRGISTFDCQTWELINCQAANQLYTDELGNFGLLAAGCSFWQMRNCDFSFNRIDTPIGPFLFPSVGGAQIQSLLDINFNILKASGSHIIDNCAFSNNFATIPGVLGRGLALVASDSCIVRNCVATGNFSVDVVEAGFVDIGRGNLYQNCLSSGNYARVPTTLGTFGFLCTQSFATSFIECIAKFNFEPPGGFASGFFSFFDSSKSLVLNCQALSNSLVGFINNSADSAYYGNLAFGQVLNYAGFGPLGFITVINGTQPPAGSFDKRHMDNISIV